MTSLFNLLALIAGLIGAAFFVGAESVMHEALAGIAFIVAAIFAVGAAAVTAINRAREAIERADRNAWTMGRHLFQVLQYPEKEHADPGEASKR